MERTNKLLCPNCGTALKSTSGIRIGRTVKCIKCGAGFTASSTDSEHATGVSPFRLALVLGSALLYVSAGGVLAVYCFVLNLSHRDLAQAQLPMQNSADLDSEPTAVSPPARQSTVPAEQQRKIDNAIADGVWFLKDHQLPAGSWEAEFPVGYAALSGLTLLECEVPSGDPAVGKAADYVRRNVVQGAKTRTYEWSLAILFLDRLGRKPDGELIQYLALCLIAGQNPENYFWGYSVPELDRKTTPRLLQELKDEKKPLNDWRKTALKGTDFDSGACDNSNTQFAMLAVWVAGRHGVAIHRSVALLEKHFRTTQLPNGPDPTGNNLNLDGAWPYNPDAGTTSNPWPTMTCSGLLGLAVAHGVTPGKVQTKQRFVDDPAIERGLAMLGREIDRPGEKRSTDLYFLWSLERVGVLYKRRMIGGKDWYAWGCKALLSSQAFDGSWKNGSFWGNTPVLNTCFALLFLKQANLAQDLTNKLHLLEKK